MINAHSFTKTVTVIRVGHIYVQFYGDCNTITERSSIVLVMSYSGCYSITGKPCTINVLEVDMDILKSTSEGLSWPAGIPRPEGVMIW